MCCSVGQENLGCFNVVIVTIPSEENPRPPLIHHRWPSSLNFLNSSASSRIMFDWSLLLAGWLCYNIEILKREPSIISSRPCYPLSLRVRVAPEEAGAAARTRRRRRSASHDFMLVEIRVALCRLAGFACLIRWWFDRKGQLVRPES